MKAVLPPPTSLATALDKESTWLVARRLGLPVPDSVLIDDPGRIPPASHFPVVLKPTVSKISAGGRRASLNVFVARTDEERLERLAGWLPHTRVQQQTYVAGRGMGVEMLYEHGRPVWHFAHEGIHEVPLTGGGSSYRRALVPPAAMLKATETILDALHWHGVAMVEYKVRPDGSFCLVEINPRLWGSLALAIDAGVNFPLGLLALAEGRSPGPQPTIRSGHYTRNLRVDLQWLWDNFRADHGDPLLMTRPRLRSFLELLRPVLGLESWDHFDLRDPEATLAILGTTGASLWRGGWQMVRRGHLLRTLGRHHRALAGRAGLDRRPRLLFLCYGNICRSPFAAERLRQRVPGLAVESAGFHPEVGRPSPTDFARLAQALGVDLSSFRSCRVTRQQVEAADLILAMDLKNYLALVDEFPEARTKTTLLGLFDTQRRAVIEDPYNAPEWERRRILTHIDSAVDGLTGAIRGADAPEVGLVSNGGIT